MFWKLKELYTKIEPVWKKVSRNPRNMLEILYLLCDVDSQKAFTNGPQPFHIEMTYLKDVIKANRVRI